MAEEAREMGCETTFSVVTYASPEFGKLLERAQDLMQKKLLQSGVSAESVRFGGPYYAPAYVDENGESHDPHWSAFAFGMVG